MMGTLIYVLTERTSTSIYTCFRGPKTCRGLAGWLAAGWLAGCGDADSRVNTGYEHFDLHVFQGSQDVPRWWER